VCRGRQRGLKPHLAEALSAEPQALFTCLTDPASVFHVPDLFYAECANILWKQAQRGNCTPAHTTTHYAALARLPLQRTATADLCADALRLALAHGITAYDACYFALAQRQGVPLITADQKLAAKLAGLSLAPIWLGNWVPPASGTP
jgi:predicted nucleic acid-binding protein